MAEGEGTCAGRQGGGCRGRRCAEVQGGDGTGLQKEVRVACLHKFGTGEKRNRKQIRDQAAGGRHDAGTGRKCTSRARSEGGNQGAWEPRGWEPRGLETIPKRNTQTDGAGENKTNTYVLFMIMKDR
jgi:hypothetical protein